MKCIYLDNLATTRTDPQVVEAMMPFWSECYGNPSSRYYPLAEEARSSVEKARAQVAAVLNVSAKDIVFTSGATEANNLAIRGYCLANRNKGTHIITTAFEHRSVLYTINDLVEKYGFHQTIITPDHNGIVSAKKVAEYIRDDTILVSVMTVNNEIGTTNPIDEISAICFSRKVAFHTDATQAIGKIPFNMSSLHITLASMSGHKIYGPKGIGALAMTIDKTYLYPQNIGGGQEGGLRSGTLNVPGIVGFGKACELLLNNFDERAKIAKMSKIAKELFINRLPGVKFNGDENNRVPHCLSVTIEGVSSEALLAMVGNRVAFSSGSACGSERSEPSHVLKAIGLTDETIKSTFRIGFGRYNTEQEVEKAINEIINACIMLRQI